MPRMGFCLAKPLHRQTRGMVLSCMAPWHQQLTFSCYEPHHANSSDMPQCILYDEILSPYDGNRGTIVSARFAGTEVSLMACRSRFFGKYQLGIGLRPPLGAEQGHRDYIL